MKKIWILMLFVSLSALAATYTLFIYDNDYDAGSQPGAMYYIRTELNSSVNQWRPGDVAVLIQNGIIHQWIYSSNGNFAYGGSTGGSGGGGIEGGGGAGGGGSSSEPELCRVDGSVCTGGGCTYFSDLKICP